MEPRTASAEKRLKTIEELAKAGVPVAVMNAPIIPGLNNQEIPTILKAAADHGALAAGMTVVRLNGKLEEVFSDWLEKNFPDRFQKVMHQIAELHGGRVQDNEFGRRMKGAGVLAESIQNLFRFARKTHFSGRSMPAFNLEKFRRGGNLNLEF